MWSTHFWGFVLNFRCKYNFLPVSATIRSEKGQKQTAQFLKHVVMTTYSRSVHAAAALSLNLASQNLIGSSRFPALFLSAEPCIMAVENSEKNE